MAPIRPELLTMLRCPVERTPLALADEALVARLNEQIAAGQIRNRGGDLCDQPLDGGLLTADAKAIYPIFDGIPVLLADEALELSDES